MTTGDPRPVTERARHTPLRPATPPAGAAAIGERSRLRAVAVPTEHGGWGLTLEPVLLGLLVTPSTAGLLIGIATLLAFLVRTPLKIVLVDRRRARWLARTRVASIVAAVEIGGITALVAIATADVGWAWWGPVILAAPLVVLELWYDAGSRSRRLAPELLGAVAISASSAAIVIAADGGWALATGAWLVLSARAVGSIPFVRAQIARLRRGVTATRPVDVAQLLAVGVAVIAAGVERRVALGAIGVGLLAVAQLVQARRTPTSATAVGLTQMAAGFTLVAVTAIGAAA